MKSHSNAPPVYTQLNIPLSIDTDAAEIGFVRTLIGAYIRKYLAGNLSDIGTEGLMNIYKDLDQVMEK